MKSLVKVLALTTILGIILIKSFNAGVESGVKINITTLITPIEKRLAGKTKSTNTNFSLKYQNLNNSGIVRYKYILNYELAKLPEMNNIKVGENIFMLTQDEEKVGSVYLGDDKSIPIVSDSFKLKKGQLLEADLEVSVGEGVKDLRDKIRFDVKVVIEELKDGMWTPVYQVIFMERGPYWSLDKGPVETINY